MHVEFEDHTGEGADKLTSKKSVQHKNSSAARQQKDTDDANKNIEYLDSENPFHVILSLCILLTLVLLPINQGLDKKSLTTWLITRFQTLWSRRVTMLWQSTSGYIRYSDRRPTSAVPAIHYCWCRYVKVWAIAMFYLPAKFGDGMMKPTGTDEKPAQELTATPDAATVQHKNLIAPLTGPTPENYYVPIWRLILN